MFQFTSESREEDRQLAPPIEIRDDLTVVIDRSIVATLSTDEAFGLAERLMRAGVRRVFVEEGAAEMYESAKNEETIYEN